MRLPCSCTVGSIAKTVNVIEGLYLNFRRILHMYLLTSRYCYSSKETTLYSKATKLAAGAGTIEFFNVKPPNGNTTILLSKVIFAFALTTLIFELTSGSRPRMN